MLDYEDDPPKEIQPPDFTGFKIGVALIPVFFLVYYFSNVDVAFSVDVILGAALFAINMRWNLRRHVWFWATISIVLALQAPLVLLVRWPQSHAPARVLALPVALVEFGIIWGSIGLAGRFFSKSSSTDL